MAAGEAGRPTSGTRVKTMIMMKPKIREDIKKLSRQSNRTIANVCETLISEAINRDLRGIGLSPDVDVGGSRVHTLLRLEPGLRNKVLKVAKKNNYSMSRACETLIIAALYAPTEAPSR